MTLLIAYFSILGLISLADWRHISSFDDYTIAGRRQNFPTVFMSLMATILGASATIGIAGRTTTIGFAAFWWLGLGGLGLLFQALFLSRPINRLQVHTLPELAEKTVGPTGRKIIALIIAISWLGVIAAQFTALSGLLSLILGHPTGSLSLLATAGIIIAYTLLGGQLSVVRTDKLQFIILAAGFAASALYVFGGFQLPSTSLTAADFVPFNDYFKPADLALMALSVGGAFFLGPDIVSRNFIARDLSSIRKALYGASLAIVIFSGLIVSLGLWVTKNYGSAMNTNPLFYLITNVLPTPLAALLALGLLSALFSSADTCLINAATIMGHDLLATNRLGITRLLVAIIGLTAMALAWVGKDIISLLTMAYSIYTPGIVAPLTVALLSYQKATIRKKLWYTAVGLGGLCGLLPTLLSTFLGQEGQNYWLAVGVALSLLLALASLQKQPPNS